MRSCGLTDVGQKRNTNQDYLFCSDEPVGAFPNLYIVADGMGGHRAGDHASHMAVERFVQLVDQTKRTSPVTMMRTLLSWVNEEVYQEANSEEAYFGMGTTRRHPRKNIITRAVGVEEEVIPDFFEIELEKGDYVLLCSDGLSNMIEDEELKDISISDRTLDEKVRYMIDKANYYGGYDNIATVLIENE